MKITIEGANEEFARQLVQLAAQQQDTGLTVHTVEPGWTADRARRYVGNLSPAALTLIRRVIEADGRADARALREEFHPRTLRGPSKTLGNTLTRGAASGWWPQDIPAPVTPESDRDSPDWPANTHYTMDAALLPLFRAALASRDQTWAQARAAARAELGYPDAESTAPAGESHPTDGGSNA